MEKTYRMTVEFDRYKKEFRRVRNIVHPSDENDHMLCFVSERGETFRFNKHQFVMYYYEEEK